MLRVITSVVRSRFDEKGLAFVLIAVIAVALLGMVAFAVDVAALYQEKRELQNGSDAAVLAIAEDCGRGVGVCDTPTAEATAQLYADANGEDDAADIDSLQLDLSAQTIEVVSRTETSDGGSVLKPFFGQVIGFDGATVKAQSKAAWGAGAGEAPITISECEWLRSEKRIQTAGFADGWYPKPPHIPGNSLYQDYLAAYGPITSPDPAWDTWDPTADPPVPPPTGAYPGIGMEIIFHTSTPEITECSAVAGQDVDGNTKLDGSFGWLQDQGDCSAISFGDQWYQGEPGNGVPCTKSEVDSWLGTVIAIPVFNDVQPPAGPDNIRSYRMTATMGLLVTGFKFPGNSENLLGGGPPCSGPTNCLVGYPTEVLSTGGPIDPGGGYRGVLVVVLLD